LYNLPTQNGIQIRPTIPTGSKVLVTGVNGLTGAHVAGQLLSAGYFVRGTVRNPEKNSWVIDVFDNKYGKGKIELIQVEDLNAEGAFDDAMKGI
jgi:nucleoside-diphosphate-sugar epimerase